jgi:hypothetical protein
MSSWGGNHVIVSGSAYCRIRIETQLASQNTAGNYSTINYQVYIDFYGCDAQLDGGFVGSSEGTLYNNGGRVYNYTGNFSNHTVTMKTGSFNVGHDANGNGSYSMNAHVAVFESGTTTASGSASLPRIPLAPTISSVIADTIKPTTARLGGEISSKGHGTGVTWTAYYKLSTAGSYTSAGSQGDVSGYNYWNLSGLKPGKLYDYYLKAVNNNGDTATSSVHTFTTQPVSGMIMLMRDS